MNTVLYILYFFIISIIIVGSTYLKITQPVIDIDEFIFNLSYGVNRTDPAPIIEGILVCLPFIIIMLFTFIYVYNKINNKTRFILIILGISIIIALYNFHFLRFVSNHTHKSDFIAENYVDPKTVNIEFENKKNVVFIILESFESTLIDKQNGGSWDYNLLPELTEIVNDEDTTIFKNGDKFGIKMISGATYTTASVFANHSALPFKYLVSKKLNEKDFASGAYTLGDYLKDNGYHNELITSATASFGGIKEYFTNHGSYDILDIDNYKDYGLEITGSDLGPWGFNDNYLFKTAKKRLSELGKSEQPFNLTLLGIDIVH